MTSSPCVSGVGAGWDPVWACDITCVSPAVTGVAIAAAAEILDALSGRQFGLCQITIRPCRRECDTDYWPPNSAGWWEYGTWPRPVSYNGVWTNLVCGSCTGGCSCTAISEALLPGPVYSVDEVQVDGVVLTPGTDYRLDDHRKLVRLGDTWPWCNDLNLDGGYPGHAGQSGTWSVTLTVGQPVPQLGKLALGELAMEFAKLLCCDDTCRLPKPVQQLVRQGVTMTFLDPSQVFAAGRVGLYLCDLFVSTVNPASLAQYSRVYDVDGPDYRLPGV